MVLAKLPIILAATAGLHVAFTPPNPAKPEERIPENVTHADKILGFSEKLRKAVPKIYLAIGLAEILTILLFYYTPTQTKNISIPYAPACAANISLTPTSVLGAVLIIAGGLLRYQCYRTLQKFFTFDFTIQKDHSLITNGPYQFVRHPSYSGLLAIYIGLFFYFLSPGSWVRECGGLDSILGKLAYGGFISIRLATFYALLRRMPKEDAALRKQFGAKWDEWAMTVKYRLVPGVY